MCGDSMQTGKSINLIEFTKEKKEKKSWELIW